MKNKLVSTLLVSVILIGSLAACSSNTASAPVAQGLDASYANAMDVRTQLLLGTIRLEEGTTNMLNKEQATKLLMLWEASKSLSASGTASQAEIDAITSQIQAAMTKEQIEAIKAMHLVQTDMQAFNVSIGMTPVSGSTGGESGTKPTPKPEVRATNQALQGATSGSGATSYLIKILQTKVGK